MRAHLRISGENCIVVHEDGSEEDFKALCVRVISELPTSLQGLMDQFKTSSNGNIRVGFDAKYFPRNDNSKTREENQQERSFQTTRKWVISGAILTELVRLGVDPKHFSAAASYRDAAGNWQNTTQIWLNSSVDRNNTSNATLTVKDLLLNLISSYDDMEDGIAVVKKIKDSYGDDEDMLLALLSATWKKRQQAMASENAKAALNKMSDAGTTTDEMPQD